MGGIQSHSMESICNVFWLVTQPFFHSIPTMESIRNVHGISNEFILQIYVLFHMDSLEESISNSTEKPIKWAVKNSANGINWTLDFVDVSHGPVQGCSSSWTMQPLKDTKFPFINHALYWSGPKWMLANAHAQFGHHQQFRQLFLNTTIIHKAHPVVTVHSKSSPFVPLS